MHVIYLEALDVAARAAWMPIAAAAQCTLFKESLSFAPVPRIAFELLLYAMPPLVLVVHPRLQSFVYASAIVLCLCVAARLLAVHVRSEGTKVVERDKVHILQRDIIAHAFTHTRAGVSLSTAIVLLVVDCSLFPKRFHKSGTYGASLMDAGVGCAAVSLGMSAARRYSLRGIPHNIALDFVRAAKASLALLALAAARLALTHAFGVGVNPEEYGMHWNFFATLAALPLATSAAVCLTRSTAGAGILGVAVLHLYQAAIVAFGLDQWMMTLPANKVAAAVFDRSIASNELYKWRMCPSGLALDAPAQPPIAQWLLDANRSGLTSTLGFVGIALVALAIGGAMHGKSVRRVGAVWAFALGACSCVFVLCVKLGVWPSRRQANLPFAAFSLALTMLHALLFLFSSWITSVALQSRQKLKGTADSPSRLEAALIIDVAASQQRVVFLAVNIAVGLFNVWDKNIIGRAHTIIPLALSVMFAIIFCARYLNGSKGIY